MNQQDMPLGNVPLYKHLAAAAVVHAQNCIGKDQRLHDDFAEWSREWASWDSVEAIINHKLVHAHVTSVFSRKKASRFHVSSFSAHRALHACDCIDEEEKLRLERSDLAGIVEVLSTILNDLEGKSYRRLFALMAEEAQDVVDLLYSLIETPPCHRSGTRRLFTDALFKLAQRSGCYPQILLLKDVEVSQNDPIGVGGFGTVYQGRYKGQAVAIKHLRDFSSKRAQKCARELVIWACMEHPNVLNFYGVYLLNGLDSSACLVSPLMENGNLVQYLNHSPDAIRESLLYDISLGLEYLHTQSIIHGDMKPENVFVALDGRACIGDYGLASVNSASQNWTTKSRSLNSGTLRYQAPELFKDAQIGRATDMYAFGCIIYEVTTGNRPYHQYVHDVAVLTAVVGGESMTTLDELPDETLRNLWSLCIECIDRDPNHRPSIENVTTRLAAMTSFEGAPQGMYSDKNLRILLETMFIERGYRTPRRYPTSRKRVLEPARRSIESSNSRRVSMVSNLRLTPNRETSRTTPSPSPSLSSLSNSKKVKMLLLGGGESGKTTLNKHMQSAQSDFRFSRLETQSYSDIITESLSEGLFHLFDVLCGIDEWDRLPEDTMSDLLYVAEWLKGKRGMRPNVSTLAAVWKEDCVREVFRAEDWPHPTNLQYFLRSIERICDPNYCATPEDIIHLQQRTIGLDQNEVVFGDLTIDLVDTGGQKSERRKWIHCFDGADFVVFCVNLAGYDLTLWEDHNDNQMQDALTVWDSLCRSKWLGSSTFILLFNKRDIYEEKILHSDIATHFPKFTGPVKDAEAGIDFFAESFMDAFFKKSPMERQIYVHTVSAINKEIVDVVMQDVRAQLGLNH